jgi:hypothetical protein
MNMALVSAASISFMPSFMRNKSGERYMINHASYSHSNTGSVFQPPINLQARSPNIFELRLKARVRLPQQASAFSPNSDEPGPSHHPFRVILCVRP